MTNRSTEPFTLLEPRMDHSCIMAPARNASWGFPLNVSFVVVSGGGNELGIINTTETRNPETYEWTKAKPDTGTGRKEEWGNRGSSKRDAFHFKSSVTHLCCMSSKGKIVLRSTSLKCSDHQLKPEYLKNAGVANSRRAGVAISEDGVVYQVLKTTLGRNE